MSLRTKEISGVRWGKRAFKWVYRVTKLGGHVLGVAPIFFWHLHEETPGFFRCKRYGSEYLFRVVGSWIEKLEALSEFGIARPSELYHHLRRFGRGSSAPLVDFAVVIDDLTALFFDRGRLYDKGFKWVCPVVTRGPDVS